MQHLLVLLALVLPASALADERVVASKAQPLEYLVQVTGGAAPTDRLPMVVAIHGLGDRPEAFTGMFRGYPGKLRIIVPRAPTPYGKHGLGGSWFRIERPPSTAMLADMRASAAKLARLITSAQARYPTRGKPIVTGFSQGGMLSFAMAVLYPELIRGAVPIAGLLPKALWPKSGPVAPVRALHGTADNRVPYSAAEALTLHLVDMKVDARLTPFQGVRHRVPTAVRAAAFKAIAEFAK